MKSTCLPRCAGRRARPPIRRATRRREARRIAFCYFIFTSGTTGLPKAAVMTQLRWMRVGYAMGQGAMRLGADDVFYCALPFHHNSALTVCWSAVLTAGATLVMARKFSASRFWDDIRANGATAFVYIGEFCRYLLALPPSPDDRRHAVRVMVGNGLRPEIWDEFQRRFGVAHVCEFYGSSEGSLGFVNALGLPRTAGVCPLPYAIVAFDAEREEPLRDARGRLRRVSPGETGLLLMPVGRLMPFDGYTDAAATGARLLHDVFRRGDTWFDSGDLVRDQGFRHIAFVDRVGDTFRWKGENVATTEVERAIGAVKGGGAGQRVWRSCRAQRRPRRHGGGRAATRRRVRRPGHGAAAGPRAPGLCGADFCSHHQGPGDHWHLQAAQGRAQAAGFRPGARR
jgi:fatty-acyl-CoA synthase